MNELGQYKYLFLDRDGVINVERPDDYVKVVSEFIFIEGTLKAMPILSQLFERIVVVTNQRGVGRVIMTEADLQSVHSYMLFEIREAGGRVDNIYVCTDVAGSSINRKPNTGMAFRALQDFPEIDFSKSVMVGNSISDIKFGRKLGMYTVLLGDKYPRGHEIYENINAFYENLYMFADSLDAKTH